MQSAGSEPDGDIACFHVTAIDQPLPLHNAHAETCEVVVALLVHVGKDGCLTANQGAVALHAAVGDAPHDALEQRRIVAAHRHVVEEKQRLGTGAQRIVDTHRHQVDADSVVNACHRGDFEFGADPVGAGDEQWILVAATEEAWEVEVKEGRKTSLSSGYPRTLRAAEVRGDPRHRIAITVEIDSGAGIGGSAHPDIFAADRRPARVGAGDRSGPASR